jgi:glycosyltransferase involved in cell wall biosynthesis
MKLITQKYNKHVSLDTVEELEQIILSNPTTVSINQTSNFFSKILYLIIKKILKYYRPNKKVQLKTETKLKTNIFAVLMGIGFNKCLPHFIYSANKSIYMFDAWPDKHDEIVNFLNAFKINNLFLTSSQAVQIIQSKTNNTSCFWIPEGISPEKYKYYNFDEKTIDVLALGRRFDLYHEQIVDCLNVNEKIYLFEKQRGKIIFPTRKGFVEGMAKSKISICVPSSITHPERSGDIETMTIRYLQSMVSKCLIIGHAPKEMITLFGYNPVIEIDSEDPKGQIISILDNYSNYFPLIEKNYKAVLENHTWTNRWAEINKLVNQN